MTSRRKTSRPKRSTARRTKFLAPEWDAIDPEYRAFFGSFEEDNPEWTLDSWTPDLRTIAAAVACDKTELLRQYLRFPYNVLSELSGGDRYVADNPRGLSAQLPDWAWLIVSDEIRSALQAGFYLAVKRYADELRQVPEFAKFRETRMDAAHKGGDVQRQKAAPKHKAICKRFRELKKTIPKATARYLRIAKEFDMDEGSIGRIIRRSNG
jgi:hypothetical protein